MLASEEEQLMASAQNVTWNLTDDDTDESDRRLASITAFPSSSFTTCFGPMPTLTNQERTMMFCYSKAWPNTRSDCPGCTCESFSAQLASKIDEDGGYGWFGSGAVSLGSYCVSPGKFAVSGTLTAGFKSVVKKKKKGVGFDCYFTASVSASGSYSKFGYKCSSDIAACVQEKDDEYESWMRWCTDNGYDIQTGCDSSSGRRRHRGVWNARRRRTNKKSYCSTDKWEDDWSATRRRFCYKDGGDVSIKIGASGGCDAGPVGVGVKGHLTFYFGPFPKNPLVPKSTGKVDFSACVRLVVTICVDLLSATLWSKQL
eukprot:6490337-Amphidinium_carterae.2